MPERFFAGELVRVLPDGPDVPERVRDCTPEWVGRVVGYWRNGCWTVAEQVHGTTCAVPSHRLEPANL